jgi:hypothetical protein
MVMGWSDFYLAFFSLSVCCGKRRLNMSVGALVLVGLALLL